MQRSIQRAQHGRLIDCPILILKIYHMQQEVDRSDATPEHKGKCEEKLRILLEQKKDLCVAWISYWQISVLDVNI